jgi:hypothetical protein
LLMEIFALILETLTVRLLRPGQNSRMAEKGPHHLLDNVTRLYREQTHHNPLSTHASVNGAPHYTLRSVTPLVASRHSPSAYVSEKPPPPQHHHRQHQLHQHKQHSQNCPAQQHARCSW